MSRPAGPWTQEQFMERVRIRPDGCWEWLGRHLGSGYAIANLPRSGGKAPKTTAHRLAYTLFVGPIAPDLDADHLCFTRWCVNPYHIEPVTHRENIHRMPGLFGRRARATHCDRGHDDWLRRSDGRRMCRTCNREARIRRETAA